MTLKEEREVLAREVEGMKMSVDILTKEHTIPEYIVNFSNSRKKLVFIFYYSNRVDMIGRIFFYLSVGGNANYTYIYILKFGI